MYTDILASTEWLDTITPGIRSRMAAKRYSIQQQQQQLPNSSRLRGVWGDPGVHDLTLHIQDT